MSQIPKGCGTTWRRAAKYACYALVNKLVFHEALLKRYGERWLNSPPPSTQTRGKNCVSTWRKHFQEAKEVTDDYETVFGEDHTGDR